MKKIISILAILFALVFIISVPVAAKGSYQTYTYSIGGYVLLSPDAYTPVKTVDSTYMGLDAPMSNPSDIVVDKNENVYIADAGNNRIICLDKYYKLRFTISNFTNKHGVPDSLSSPNGIFVTKDRIFICDTNKNRIITCDLEGNYLDTIEAPESTLFEEGAIYKPIAIAVDQFDRLYVVSSTTYQGVIVMTDKGEFTGFIGAQKVSISLWDIIWRRFQTEDQRSLSQSFVSTEFNNIAIDEDGFIYVTTSSLDAGQVQSAIRSHTKSGDYSPVKMLNNKGTEIMRRNGFWPPMGEIAYSSLSTDKITGVSTITDVAIGPEKTWSIIDEKRNKIYTYDFDGNLLFAFGDTGQQLGNVLGIEGLTYQGDFMLVLDRTSNNITIFRRTEYGDVMMQALNHQNTRQFDKAVDDWTEILKRNSNFDTAYIGIGQALYRNGDYEEALEYFEAAYDTSNYSQAYKEIRKEWISKYILLLPVIVIAVCYLCTLFNKYAKKINSKIAKVDQRRTFKEELLYGFHVIFHPFDGFWDLKHEKRGSFKGAIFYLAFAIVAFTYQSSGTAYVFNPTGKYSSIISQIISLTIPVVLWVVANWCFTTLFEGEGSLKDIFIATCYSLAPIPLMIIPSVIATNFLTASEGSIITLLESVAWIWVGFLVFIGTMVTHDYSLGKNILMCICTIVGMVFIMFIALLFTTMLTNVLGFITSLITEISYGM
jgi:sugar lactone lactonase YvrE